MNFKFVILEGTLTGKVIDVHETRMRYARTLMNRGVIKALKPSKVENFIMYGVC